MCRNKKQLHYCADSFVEAFIHSWEWECWFTALQMLPNRQKVVSVDSEHFPVFSWDIVLGAHAGTECYSLVFGACARIQFLKCTHTCAWAGTENWKTLRKTPEFSQWFSSWKHSPSAVVNGLFHSRFMLVPLVLYPYKSKTGHLPASFSLCVNLIHVELANLPFVEHICKPKKSVEEIFELTIGSEAAFSRRNIWVKRTFE